MQFIWSFHCICACAVNWTFFHDCIISALGLKFTVEISYIQIKIVVYLWLPHYTEVPSVLPKLMYLWPRVQVAVIFFNPPIHTHPPFTVEETGKLESKLGILNSEQWLLFIHHSTFYNDSLYPHQRCTVVHGKFLITKINFSANLSSVR